MKAIEAKIHAYRMVSNDCVRMAAKLAPDKVQLAVAKLSEELKNRSEALRKTMDRANKKKEGKKS